MQGSPWALAVVCGTLLSWNNSKEPVWPPAELVLRVPCPCYRPICTAGSPSFTTFLSCSSKDLVSSLGTILLLSCLSTVQVPAIFGVWCAVTCARIVWGFVKGLLKVENHWRSILLSSEISQVPYYTILFFLSCLFSLLSLWRFLHFTFLLTLRCRIRLECGCACPFQIRTANLSPDVSLSSVSTWTAAAWCVTGWNLQSKPPADSNAGVEVFGGATGMSQVFPDLVWLCLWKPWWKFTFETSSLSQL